MGFSEVRQGCPVIPGKEALKKLHLFFDERHREHSAIWERNDAFLFCEGTDDVVIYPFRLFGEGMEARLRIVEERLHDPELELFGYRVRVAAGTIALAERTWRFTEPIESAVCGQLIARAVADDAEFVRYYGDCRAIAPDGSDLDIIRNYLRRVQR